MKNALQPSRPTIQPTYRNQPLSIPDRALPAVYRLLLDLHGKATDRDHGANEAPRKAA